MPDWMGLLETAGQVARGAAAVATIREWLDMDDSSAFSRIEAQVASSSTAEVDQLDEALLGLAAMHLQLPVRERVIKFYVVFKVAELQRYQQWRGFPSLAS